MKMDIIKKVRNVEWEYEVNRKEALLLRSLIDPSYYNLKKLTGINWRANKIVRFSSGEFYHDKKEMNRLFKIYDNGGIEIMNRLKRALVRNVNYLYQVAEKKSKINVQRLSRKELAEHLREFFQAALNAHCFFVTMVVADRVITAWIKEWLEKSYNSNGLEDLFALIYPKKQNVHFSEQLAFLKLIQYYQNNDKNIKSKIKLHVKKFGLIGARNYRFQKNWNESDILDRIKQFLKQKKDPVVERKNLILASKDAKLRSNRILKGLKIKNKNSFKIVIELAKEFAYLRTWRSDIIYVAGFKSKHLFYETLSRYGVDANNAEYYTYKEILNLVKRNKSVPEAEINKRKKGYVTLYWNRKYGVFSDPKIISAAIGVIEIQNKNEKVVKGNTAFPGVITGKATIVLSPEDLVKVKTGDILVAVMTFPHYIAAMEKASAFVTDEGGILCHAAIIAREMGKPCIVGTKNGTRLIKDGDHIIVNAEKGTVVKT